ncbi:hypothetical protein [Mesorhizobium sp.]|uniref:hypothetical protein n=1 Tax=Mesorhizobium sp. TaxID=1871066 RepID=UPI0025E554C7|nr:hypothetical protein [Mesorhizobium sp.]
MTAFRVSTTGLLAFALLSALALVAAGSAKAAKAAPAEDLYKLCRQVRSAPAA